MGEICGGRITKKHMINNLDELKKLLGPTARENVSLAPMTTFKVGGPADLYFEARTADQLEAAVVGARTLGVPLFMLGGGTNILIGDRGIRGLVIRNLTTSISIRGMKGERRGSQNAATVYVEADSGVFINKLVRFTVEEGLAGLQMQLGLPGSVGGAIYMNSKWTHPEGYVGDSVYQARMVTRSGEIVTKPKSYFRFAYDSSTIQETGDVVLSVTFALTTDSKERLWQIANESIAYRRLTQPQGVFSAGCTFRNLSRAEALSIPTPNNTTSAGYLVDHAGLKGYRVGGAEISPVHANFIVNRDKATAADVVELIDMSKDRVFAQFGVKLEEEIIRVGEF